MKIDRYLFLFVLGLTVGVALFACAAGAASDVPEIVTDPTSGGPGTRVTICGSGFPADTELNVRLGPPNVGATPQSYGHVLPGAAGEFVLSLIMPGQWPDGTPITERDLLVVIINDDGSIKAVAPFSFEPGDAAQPALSLTPGNGTPGERVLVKGHDFRAGARVGLRLGVPETGPGNVKLAEVQVDGSGAFETTLAIPTTWTDSGAAVTEQDLSITAVDESIGQTLASVPFFNFEGRATSDGAAKEPLLDPVQFYTNEEGGFSLLLPPDWVVQGPTSTPLGAHYLLGPSTLVQAGPGNSSIFVADARQFSVEDAVAQLCGGCTSLPALQDAVVNGVEAKLATIGGEGAPVLEWVFVQYEGKLIYLSIHDPETLQPLDGVVQTFSLGVVPLSSVTLPAAQIARQWLATHLDVNPYTIVIVNSDAVEWPDACLGAAVEGEMCAQVVTPGYTGVLQTRTAQYEYRVDQTGNNVRVTPGAALGARQLIAQQLHVDLDAVSIVSFERVDWPDACLGVVAAGEVCAQGATPGYRVVLQTGDQRYQVHTDDAGEALRLASAPEPEITDAALVWTYHGDGGCQMATFGSETVAFGFCGAALMSGKYAVPERAEAFIYFVETFLPFEAETPAGSVRFSGHGTREALPAVQRMMAEWARLAQIEARGGRSGASYGLALAWHREGGSAGLCEDLTVYVTGEVFASSCRGEQPQNLARGCLTAVQLGQLYAWVDGLKNFELEEMYPATADATTIRIVFSGRGASDATDADKHAIGDFALNLFKEFNASAEGSFSPGAELPPGPRLVVQRPDGGIQYVGLDGTGAVLVADAPASLRPAGFDSVPMTDGPMVYVRQWWGGFYVLDTPLGHLFPLDFIPMDSSPLAVRLLTDGLLPDGSPISLAWGEFSATQTPSARLYLAASDGSHKAEILKASYDTSDPLTQFVPWRWRQDGRLYFTKEPIDGMGGFRPFTNAANLWVLDPSSGTGTELVSDDVTGGQLCLDAIAPNDRLVAHHCDQGQITLLDLETGMATAVSWPDQATGDALSGSVRFSPDGSHIAYAVMTGGFGMIEQTRGYVAVSDSLSGDSHIVAMSEPGQWFSVAAWLSGDWLVLQSHYAGPDGRPAVWIVRTDGSGLSTLADGVFLAKFDG